MITWHEYQTWLNTSFIPVGALPPSVDRWHTDSRTISPGDWFIPLVGENFDGHQFIDAAIRGGAAGFLYNQASTDQIDHSLRSRGIPVANTMNALQAIAQGWRRTLKRCTLFGLTGSSGKTTTKEMLASILSVAGHSYSNKRNFNNEIGVSLTLCQIKQEHQYAALEFGARHTGDIALLCQISEPDICCLLNVGQAHLGIFGSLDALINAKWEIFTSSKQGSIWITNADDTNIMSHANRLHEDTITFGWSEKARVRIMESRATANHGMHVTIAIDGKIVPLELSTFHTAHPHNLAACCAMAHAAGIPLDTIKSGLEAFRPLAGRFFQYDFGRKIIIDDTYNANPESMRRGLESLQSLYPQAQKAVILGDMLELGDDSARYHRELGLFCRDHVNLERLYTVGVDSEQIGRALGQHGFDQNKIMHFHTAQDLIVELESIISKGDIFYFKGSHSIRLDTIIDAIKQKLT